MGGAVTIRRLIIDSGDRSIGNQNLSDAKKLWMTLLGLKSWPSWPEGAVLSSRGAK